MQAGCYSSSESRCSCSPQLGNFLTPMGASKAIRMFNILCKLLEMNAQIHQRTYKWKLAKSSNMVIQHDAEFNTNMSKGNQQEIGSKTNFGPVA